MNLKSFRVGPYRNVLDSGKVEADPDVTVLVGKNESGKTNLLHALHALNPANGTREFPRLDYPRWLQKRHERSGEFDQAKAVEITFDLDSSDVAAVENRFGPGVLTSRTLSAYRSYESSGHRYFQPTCSVEKAMEHLLADVDIPPANDISTLRATLQAEATATDEEGQPTPSAAIASQVISKIAETYGEYDSVAKAVAALLHARMPHFFYFDDFAQLPGTADTAPLIRSLKSGEIENLMTSKGLRWRFFAWGTRTTNSSLTTTTHARPNCKRSAPS